MLRPLPLSFALTLLLQPFAGKAADTFKPKAEHIVLIVWDGMRPDFLTAEGTPNLHALAKSGTFFNNNHSVYITSTEVNGAAIATGCYPNRTGILANREYRPAIDPLKPFATENAKAMLLGDAVRGGKYLGVKTIAELVQQAGHRTAIAGTKPVALLHDRAPDKSASHGSAIVFAGKSYPEDAAKKLTAALGAFPDYPPIGTVAPNTAENAWTTRALVEELWRDGVPKFSTLWLGDPDFSQHLTQPGSPTALAAIRDSDTNLGTLLAALKAKGVRDQTDLFIVSDHAFSTVDRVVELTPLFKAGGFTIVRDYKAAPRPGEVLIINLGGTNQLYVPGHDPALIRKLVTFLQTTDFAGPIFTRTALPGTFALLDARLDSADSADIVFSFRWTDVKNQWGAAGSFVAEGRRAGFGTHASLSRFDVHNTLVAAGPDIRAGFVDALPSGNVDVAPTILAILGITPPEPRDGRVLREALANVDWQAPQPETKTVEAKTKNWRQYLKITTFADHTYLDEGNAKTRASATAKVRAFPANLGRMESKFLSVAVEMDSASAISTTLLPAPGIKARRFDPPISLLRVRRRLAVEHPRRSARRVIFQHQVIWHPLPPPSPAAPAKGDLRRLGNHIRRRGPRLQRSRRGEGGSGVAFVFSTATSSPRGERHSRSRIALWALGRASQGFVRQPIVTSTFAQSA